MLGFVGSVIMWKSWKQGERNKRSKCESGNVNVKYDDESKAAYENLVGNTPLVKLRRASELTGCNVMVKMECMNPGVRVFFSSMRLHIYIYICFSYF